MKIYISYFYQIRFFKPWMIPVSTACGDPDWYHNWLGKSYTYLDRRRVVNGLRCEELHPNETCDGLCRGRVNCQTQNPTTCEFLKQYRKQLEQLDLGIFMQRVEESLQTLKKQLQLNQEPVLVLIVHESIANPCGERAVLLEYFNSHGIECEELKYPIGENYE